MTLNEKIEQLQSLFTQRAAIDQQIAILIGQSAEQPLPKKRGRRKWGQKAADAEPGKHKGRPRKLREYRCLNCGNTFKSNLPKIDAYCPNTTCNKSTPIEEVAS